MGRALACAGDAWSMLILRDIAQGVTRFDALRKRLAIAPNILTRRLKALVEDGLVERRRYAEHPPRDEYMLTDAGQDFLPILHALGAWGRKHRGGGRLSHFVDVDTDQQIDPVVIDRRTGMELRTRSLALVMPEAFSSN